jgi:enoyl-CoA hydratase
VSEVQTRIEGAVGIITIERHKALNAINHAVMAGMLAAAECLDTDDAVGCIVITGAGEKAFIAGADIPEMADKSFADMALADLQAGWQRFAATRKPMIAAVNGFALGGGCEIAMMCDIILASDTARFGLPEVKLGVIPGWGGTQRLVRAVGKAKAMELILTGRMIDAAEAERIGLVSRVIPRAQLMDEALAMARLIAGYGRLSVLAAKDAVNRSFETSLAEGVHYERRAFYSLFATEDQKEGMAAFVGKRPAAFLNR